MSTDDSNPINPINPINPSATGETDVLPGLPELPDDQSWAVPTDPISQTWKRLVAILGVALFGLGAFSLGAKLKKDPASAAGGAAGAAAGLGRTGRGQFGGTGGFGATASGVVSAVPTTFAPVVGKVAEVDPDILTVTDAAGESHIFAITDETVFARTRSVQAGDLAVDQSVSVEPADADGLVAKQVTATATAG